MGIYIKEENQPWNHKQIAGNATGDNALDATSDNNIKNKVVAAKLGNTDISSIGNGTVTGAISQLNSDLSEKVNGMATEFIDDANSASFPSTKCTHTGTTNLPYQSWGVLFSFVAAPEGSNWKYQIWFDIGVGIYYRNNINTVGWSSWKLLQSAN